MSQVHRLGEACVLGSLCMWGKWGKRDHVMSRCALMGTGYMTRVVPVMRTGRPAIGVAGSTDLHQGLLGVCESLLSIETGWLSGRVHNVHWVIRRVGAFACGSFCLLLLEDAGCG